MNNLSDDGVRNTIEILQGKVDAASYRIDCGSRPRTIISVDMTEVIVLTWALHEYARIMEVKKEKK